MATKSSAGWLILVVSLAVPGALFYQWHRSVDDAHRKDGSVTVRIGHKRFPPSVEKDRLVNPMAAKEAPAALAPAPPSPPAVGGALASGLASLPAPALPPAPEVPAFVEWRDPTLSPHDVQRLEEIRIEKERIIIAMHDQAGKPKTPRSKPKPSAEQSLVLQGIIYIDEGNHSAIVNGETVHAGQVIDTPAGPVKVLGITPQQVRFSHLGRRFSMSVNQ